MKEQSSRQFNRLVQICLKFVTSNFQRVLTFLLATVAIETQQLIIAKSFPMNCSLRSLHLNSQHVLLSLIPVKLRSPSREFSMNMVTVSFMVEIKPFC